MTNIEIYSAYLPYEVDIEFDVSEVRPNCPTEKRLKTVTPESMGFCIKYGRLILKPLSELTNKIVKENTSYSGMHTLMLAIRYDELEYKTLRWLLKNHYDIYNLIDQGKAINYNEL